MKKVKIISALAFLLIGLVNTNDVKAKALDETWDYECDFSSIEEVNENFNAYYLTKFMGGLTSESVTESIDGKTHWYLNDNSIKRANDIGVNYNADSLAMLYYNKKTYSNFKMQVDIYQGTTTSFWSALNLRVTTLGKHPFEDGCMFYSEWDGSYRAWGDGLHGGPFYLGKINNYNQSNWYTYTITLTGNMMHVNVKDSDSNIEACDFDVKLQWKYYQEGYVSFLSINNDSAYRNFKIKGLEVTNEVTSNFNEDQKVEASTSDDSLDVICKETNKGEVDDLIEVKELKKEEKESKGCNSSIKSMYALLLLIILSIIFGVKKYGKV